MMFAGGEESRSDLFEASVASVAFVVRDPCPGVGQVPRSFWFRGTRQIGEQTSHGETVKFRYLPSQGGSTGAEKRVFDPPGKNNAVPLPVTVCLFVL